MFLSIVRSFRERKREGGREGRRDKVGFVRFVPPFLASSLLPWMSGGAAARLRGGGGSTCHP